MAQGGDKTEQPTEKRLRDARRKGQVTKSADLTSALLLIGAIAVLWFAGRQMSNGLSEAMSKSIPAAASFQGELDQARALSALWTGAASLAWALAPLFAVLFILALLISYLQVGSVFAFERVKPNLQKLNPAENFQQKFFKARPYVEIAKTLLKITLTVCIAGTALWDARLDLLRLSGQDIPRTSAFVFSLSLGIGLKVGLSFLVLGIGDYFLQRFLHLKELKMTKQEVKEEFKESEGDPLIKGARRQLHREILTQNMIAAVREAHVVVVNPAHVAVALKYDRKTMGAPLVVAKGAELIAARIREAAQEAKVPIMRDVPLARTLYELEVDAEIPEELYQAVAVVLRWVYQLAEQRGEV